MRTLERIEAGSQTSRNMIAFIARAMNVSLVEPSELHDTFVREEEDDPS